MTDPYGTIRREIKEWLVAIEEPQPGEQQSVWPTSTPPTTPTYHNAICKRKREPFDDQMGTPKRASSAGSGFSWCTIEELEDKAKELEEQAMQ